MFCLLLLRRDAVFDAATAWEGAGEKRKAAAEGNLVCREEEEEEVEVKASPVAES